MLTEAALKSGIRRHDNGDFSFSFAQKWNRKHFTFWCPADHGTWRGLSGLDGKACNKSDASVDKMVEMKNMVKPLCETVMKLSQLTTGKYCDIFYWHWKQSQDFSTISCAPVENFQMFGRKWSSKLKNDLKSFFNKKEGRSDNGFLYTTYCRDPVAVLREQKAETASNDIITTSCISHPMNTESGMKTRLRDSKKCQDVCRLLAIMETNGIFLSNFCSRMSSNVQRQVPNITVIRSYGVLFTAWYMFLNCFKRARRI